MSEQKRQTISKKLRFEVFKRDQFCCQYCGKTPPAITLEVDHIIPVSKSGNNIIENLTTSCFDCNRGKSNIELDKLPPTTEYKIFLLKEKKDQYKSFQKLIADLSKLENSDIDKIENLFQTYYPTRELSESFKASIRSFLKKIGYQNVYDAMEKACSYLNQSKDSLNYFCGICWNMIKNNSKNIHERK